MMPSNRLLGAGAMLAVLLAAGPAGAENPWWKLWSGQDAAGGAAPAPAPRSSDSYPVAQAPGAPDSASRLDRIEGQMRTITGQIEELSYQLRQLQDELKRMQDDNEFRFGELESGNPPVRRPPSATAAVPATPRPPAPAPQPPLAAVVVAGGANANPDAAAAPPPPPANQDLGSAKLGAPPQPLGALVLDAPADAGGSPLDLSTLARGANPAVAAPAPQPPGAARPAAEAAPATVGALASLGDSRSDYDRAYNYVLSGDYDLAETSFRQFLTTYPRDALAPDAQYWLGESFFERARYREAADQFLAGYKAYPKSAKGPDTLLKLGLSLAGLGEREAACQTYAQVLNKYPQASNALRQRVLTEQSSANC